MAVIQWLEGITEYRRAIGLLQQQMVRPLES
jgi:hypothetical protein